MKPSVFYAKIMLFGEYSVIWDSMGLTIPYTHFGGELAFIKDDQHHINKFTADSNSHLRNYFNFLKGLRDNPMFTPGLDLERLEKDICRGLYFESNIPQGYGIGSSGALVAAVYDEYQAGDGLKNRKDYSEREIVALKESFAFMESYFHGTSSGIDPLLCYIRHPLLIRSKKQIETINIPGGSLGDNGAVFLIDTKVLGKTGPLVSLFREKCREGEYLERVKKVMIPANDGCIAGLLKGSKDELFRHLADLSAFQYEYLSEMIPKNMKPLWNTSLDRVDFKMKLCGSGGGGFLLGFSKDFMLTREYFHQEGIEPIPVFMRDLP